MENMIIKVKAPFFCENLLSTETMLPKVLVYYPGSDMTEKLLTGTLSLNTHQIKTLGCYVSQGNKTDHAIKKMFVDRK